MVTIKNYRIIIAILLSIFLVSTTFAAYPEFEFTTTSFPAGQVDIEGRSSSGTQIELYVNDNFVGTQDIYAQETLVILDGSDIENIQVPLAGTLRIRNDDFRTYLINISDQVIETLDIGESLTYRGDTIGQIIYRDELSDTQRTIDIFDELTSFNFTDVTTYMIDGQNTFRFIQKYPYPTFVQSQEFTQIVSYEKYPNTITVTNYTNVTQESRVTISGNVADSRYPIHYLLNINPSTVGNSGALQDITLTGSLFNVTINSLREGENNIYLVTTDPTNPNVYTGLETVTVLVDTIAPDIEIESVKYRSSGATFDTVLDGLESELYINGQTMILNISTDATIMNYTFNNETFSADVNNDSVSITLNLKEGLNPLVLTAIDIAGNINKESHNIYFDNSRPELDKSSLEPKEMFQSNSGTAHFFWQEIEGRLKDGKPGVQMTIFTLPHGATDYDGNPVTCQMYEEVYARNLGQLDREDVDSVELNIEEYQIALTSLMYQTIETTSDGSGNFDALIALQEKNYDRRDYNDARRDDEPEYVDPVASKNQICFIMVDKFGNIGVDSRTVMLDAGNTMWRAGEITTIPNTVYAAEIAQTGDVREGTGNVEFSMIVNFQYIGPDFVSHLDSIRIQEDEAISEFSKYIKIDTSRMNYRLDKESGEMLVHVPVKIYPIKNIEPVDYPGNLDLGFKAYVKYSVGDKEVPIDEVNPIYFQTSINVERPLDHTKWLTPEMIDKWVNFLDRAINFTQKAVDWTGKASVVGVLACTGSKFWYGVSTVGASEKEKQEAKKQMFMICDRVACTASPQRCEGGFDSTDKGTNGVFELNDKLKLDDNDKGKFSGTDLTGNAQIVNNAEDKEIMAQFDTLEVNGRCDYSATGENDGVWVSGKVTKYEEETGSWSYTATSQGYVKKFCAPAKVDETTNQVTAINLQGASGACYQEGHPKFDETRCNFFGADPSGAPGWDPSDNVIESIRCGCITDTYSHLKNYLRIMESIKGCLQQAKLGEVQGSYCERLVGQAVCDIATNVLFKTIAQKSVRGKKDGNDPHNNIFLEGLQGMQEGDKILNDRYSGTFMDKAGLTSDAIVNKVCLGAISGDWSVLTDNILASVDQNEVEPIFGPMIPESRLQGYNPLTGDLSISYRFTYAGVSGGQAISTDVEFICDSQAPGGEHCPDGYYTSENSKMGSTFSLSKLYIREGASAQDTVVVTDTKARYRYNIVKLTHKYSLKGETKTKTIEENIFHKGEFMLASCYFSPGALGAGSGFNCEALFTQDSLLSAYTINDKYTKIVPNKGNTFYPENNVYVDLHYDVRVDEGNEQSSFDLAYVAICQGKGDGQAIKKDVVPIYVSRDSINAANKVVSLFKVPQLGSDITNEKKTYSYELKDEDARKITSATKFYLEITNVAGTTGQELLLEKGGLSTEIQGVNIGQNLVVNGGGSNPTIQKNVNIKTYSEGDVLTIAFSGGQVKNINVALIVEDSKGKRVGDFPMQAGATDLDVQYEFDKLQAGSCTLELKILPAGEGSAAIADHKKFAEYSPLSDDIQVDSKQSGQDYKKMTFKVAAKPSIQTAAFKLFKPYDESSYCINPTATTIDLEYIYQTSDNKPFETQSLDVALTVDGYAHVAKNPTPITLKQGISESIKLDISEIVPALAGKTSAKATLKYDLKLQYDDDPKYQVKTESEEIEFYISVPKEGDTCEEYSIFNEPEEKPKTSGDAEDNEERER